MYRMKEIFHLSLFFLVINYVLASSPLGPSVDPLPNGTYTSYLKAAVCTPSDPIRTPQSSEEVLSIVQEAIARNTTVKAFGHRHSLSDIICTNGIPVDMRGIQGMTLNDDLTVTAGAGVYMHDLTDFMKQRGRAFKTTPAFGNITIGGAIGTGAHGSTLKFNSSISSQVVGLTIIDGQGAIQNITAPEDLHAFRIHLGLLGIIINVTLDTVPLYKVRAHNYLVSDDIMTNGKILDIARNTDQITAYWFPSFKKVLIANWTIVPVNTPGEAKTNDHVPPTSATFNSYVVPAIEVFQSINSYVGLNILQAYTMLAMLTTIPDFVPIYTTNDITVENPAVGYYDVMFAPICHETGFRQCFWQHGPNNNITLMDNEITIDMQKLPQFAQTVKDVSSKTPTVFPNEGILLRFSSNSSTYMSTSYGKDSCHVEFYTLKRKNPYEDSSSGLAAYQTIMQSLAKTYKGISHWGKSGMYYHSKESIELKLDAAARASFLSKMQQYDPNGIFMNDFGNRLKGVATKMNTDPATTHCALLDNCICSKNTDCANGQICSTVIGYPNYPVCKDPLQLPVILDPNAYNFNTSLRINELLCTSNLGSLLTSTLNCTLGLIGNILG